MLQNYTSPTNAIKFQLHNVSEINPIRILATGIYAQVHCKMNLVFKLLALVRDRVCALILNSFNVRRRWRDVDNTTTTPKQTWSGVP